MAEPEADHPMAPAEWGKNAWRFLHSCSFAYPNQPTSDDKEAARLVFSNLGNILPCPVCKGHYNDHLKTKPPAVGSREELARWLVGIHNQVNKSRNLPEVEFEKVKRHYMQNSHELDCECKKTKYLKQKLTQTQNLLSGLTIVSIILVALLICMVGVRAYKRRRS